MPQTKAYDGFELVVALGGGCNDPEVLENATTCIIEATERPSSLASVMATVLYGSHDRLVVTFELRRPMSMDDARSFVAQLLGGAMPPPSKLVLRHKKHDASVMCYEDNEDYLCLYERLSIDTIRRRSGMKGSAILVSNALSSSAEPPSKRGTAATSGLVTPVVTGGPIRLYDKVLSDLAVANPELYRFLLERMAGTGCRTSL